MENDETAQCAQEEFYAFARKPHNNVTEREFPRRPSEYVNVQKEHPKQRGNDTSEKILPRSEDATGDAIKRRKNYARLAAQVPASSVAKKSPWHRKAGARKAQCQAKKTGFSQEVGDENAKGKVKDRKTELY